MSKLIEKFIHTLLWLLVLFAGKTWRVKVIMPPSVNIFDPHGTPSIYCFWHATLLITSYVFRNTNKSAIVSPSRDGRRAATMAQKLGHAIIFGSSNKGGSAALRQSLKALKAGRSIAITPDGPKGPKEVAKPGAAQISLVSKCPLITIKVNTKNAWRLKSWDGFLIPKLFAKITLTLSEPLYPEAAGNGGTNIKDNNDINNTPPDNNSENALIALTKRLEEAL